MSRLGVAVLGAGRIGTLHARHLAGSVVGARLVAVMDVDRAAAERAAACADAAVASDVDEVLGRADVDAVVIASPTSLHADHVRAAAAAGKPIFCEKPIALDLATTDAALSAVRDAGVPFQIGFNRRYDPGFGELRRRVRKGVLGAVELFRSQSSDPAPPTAGYLATSGGIYRDSVIHDLDMARFVVGDVDRVTALGRVLVDDVFARHDDVDTSVLTLEFASGALGTITNSRRTVYGYDLRIEVHGEHGKLVSEDEQRTKLWQYDRDGMHGDYFHYFLDRFVESYRRELEAFVNAVAEDREPDPGPADARAALALAEAATRSLHEGRPVAVEEIA